MITITTSRGKEFEATFIGIPYRVAGRMFLEVRDDRPLSEVAAEFELIEHIKKMDDLRPGEVVQYEGYTKLTGAVRNEDGTIRLTLEKPKEG